LVKEKLPHKLARAFVYRGEKEFQGEGSGGEDEVVGGLSETDEDEDNADKTSDCGSSSDSEEARSWGLTRAEPRRLLYQA
jgi:hypothetical protein